MFISSTAVIFLYIRFRPVVYNCDDNSRDILVHVVPHNLVVFCCYGIMNAMFKLECGMFVYGIVCLLCDHSVCRMVGPLTVMQGWLTILRMGK